MTEVANLVIRVSSDQVSKAKTDLDKLGYSASTVERATGGLAGAFKTFLVPLLSVTAAVQGLRKLYDVGSQFETLNAQLKTATGSADGAKRAFEAIQDFAAQTPYSLSQSVEAFIMLTNRGLTPSEAALRSYGNTASAMGKDLTQMVQAVANATTGEFEMLKQFGIKAQTEGDKIRFSFRGSTEVIKNDAASIEQYLTRIGQVEFAGAMSERMQTLQGRMSNLSDAWDNMWNEISKAGSGELMAQGIQLATDAISELTAMIASGELVGYIEAIGGKFTRIFDDIVYSFNYVTSLFAEETQGWGKYISDAFGFVLDSIINLPENVRAVIQSIGATFGLLVEYASAAGRGIYDAIAAWFNYLVDTAKNIGKEIGSHLNPFSKDKQAFNYVEEQQKAYEKFGNSAVNAWKQTTSGIGYATTAWEEQITAIMDQRDADLAAFDQGVKHAKDLRKEWDEANKARAEASKGKDRLEGFKVESKGPKPLSQQDSSAFKSLRDSLILEEQSVTESYAKRRDLILRNTELTAEQRADLEKRLEQKYTLEFEEVTASRLERVQSINAQINEAYTTGNTAKLDSLYTQLEYEENALNESLEYRKNMILENATLTEEQKNQKIAQLQGQAIQMQRQIELQRNKMALNLAADFFGNISQIAGAFGKKGAKIAKAAAIAQATIKTYESATSAYASLAGIPYVGPALGVAAAGAAIAAGMANIAQIKSTDYAGAYAHGGMIPAGKYGMVNEAGPELVRGPAVVTSAANTADRYGRFSSGGSDVRIIVNNYAKADVEVEERDDGQGKLIQLTIKQTKAELVRDLRSGASPLNSALENVYGLRKGLA